MLTKNILFKDYTDYIGQFFSELTMKFKKKILAKN